MRSNRFAITRTEARRMSVAQIHQVEHEMDCNRRSIERMLRGVQQLDAGDTLRLSVQDRVEQLQRKIARQRQELDGLLIATFCD